MHISIVHPNPVSAQGWREALMRELPGAHVEVWSEASASDATYAVGWAVPPSGFFARQPALKAFFSTGAGVEKILASAALPVGLPVVRLEDAGMGEQMVDYALYEVLRWMRRRADYAQRQGEQSWKPLPAEDKADWPVGVFGIGVLGRQVAAAFAELGFKVNGYARSAHAQPAVQCYAEQGGAGDFAAFMRATRVLVIMAPLTAATRDRFDRDTLSLLPRGAYLINVARGELLVENDLLALLDSGHLAGAALDVFREEPLPPQHRFWTHPKVSVTPHVSAITLIAPSAQQVAAKIRRLERGEPITGLVDRSRGY